MVVEGALAVTVADTRAEHVHAELWLRVHTRHGRSLQRLDRVELVVRHSQVVVSLLEVDRLLDYYRLAVLVELGAGLAVVVLSTLILLVTFMVEDSL